MNRRLERATSRTGRATVMWLSLVALVTVPVPVALAQSRPIVYPAKGQNAQLQATDEAECGAWARNTTGIDPATLAPPATESGPAVGGGERARGAARGAVGGLAIGAIAGDAGKGAAIGAVGGTLVGGHRARQNQASRNQQAQSQHAQKLNTYYRAMGACLEGRGYTIK